MYRIGIMMAVAVLVGASVVSGNAILPILAIGGGMLLLYLSKKRVNPKTAIDF